MAAPDFHYESQRFLVMRRFRDLPEALLFESILDSAAIECFLADKNTIRMDWLWSNALGGIKLCVRTADADEAWGIINQSVPEKFDAESIGEYQQPRCPKCQSFRVSSRGLNKAADYTRALLGGPRPLHRRFWECDSCGRQWPESDEKPPANFMISASSIFVIAIMVETFAVMLLSLIEFGSSAVSRWCEANRFGRPVGLGELPCEMRKRILSGGWEG